MSVLYHYTSLQGFIGLMQNKSIWCSHCEFLNDSSEFVHALKFASHTTSRIFMEDDYLNAFSWLISETVHKLELESRQVFVTSFSEKADLLSQWRGYCPQGAGVAIGFDKKLLNEYAVNHGIRLEKCMYETSTQAQLINGLIDECLEHFPPILNVSRRDYDEMTLEDRCRYEVDSHIFIQKPQNRAEVQPLFDKLVENINFSAPLMKHQGFHEEAEWRFIACNPIVDVHYRASKSHLVPYLILPIIKEFPEIIKDIYIGPNPRPHKCEQSIELLLKTENFKNVEIHRSKIPFSSW